MLSVRMGVAVMPICCGGSEVFEDFAPVALVAGAAPVALVHDDQVEEVARVLLVERRRIAGPAMAW